MMIRSRIGLIVGSRAVASWRVKYFGMTLASWAGKDVPLKEFLSGVHLATSWMIAALVGVHACGALKHALVDRDGLLARMGIGRIARP